MYAFGKKLNPPTLVEMITYLVPNIKVIILNSLVL